VITGPWNQSLVGLRHEQEQDEANAVAWMKEASVADVKVVWAAIQAMDYKTMPNGELISRFAQLGMSHAMLLAKGG
jgi:hypothetical protein